MIKPVYSKNADENQGVKVLGSLLWEKKGEKKNGLICRFSPCRHLFKIFSSKNYWGDWVSLWTSDLSYMVAHYTYLKSVQQDLFSLKCVLIFRLFLPWRLFLWFWLYNLLVVPHGCMTSAWLISILLFYPSIVDDNRLWSVPLDYHYRVHVSSLFCSSACCSSI